MNQPPPDHQRAVSLWGPQTMLEASNAPSLAAAATMLARAGISLFPCVPHGKQPLTTRGFRDATSDPHQVEAWWRRWPDANIGLPTGAPSGIDVVDVDVHKGGTGFAAFERARSTGLVCGWAWLVRTPSAGLHAYFLRTSHVEQRSWQVPGKHVDFRGDGGYVIAPPSQVATADGLIRGYEVIAVAQHQPQPVDAGGLRVFLDPPRLLGGPDSAPAPGARPDKLAAWVASRPEGARNGSLFWASCRLAEDGHRMDAALSLLGGAAQDAGLTDREAETTIRSAFRIASRLGRPETASRPFATEAVSL